MDFSNLANKVIDAVKKRREAGMTLEQALEGTGIGREAYYNAMRNPDGKRCKLESVLKRQYVERYYTQQGMAVEEISNLLGLKVEQVNKFLREIGIKPKPKPRKRVISPERAAAEDRERNMLERMINVEMRTLIEISQETGLSTSVIKTRIKRYGIVRGEKARKRLKKGDTADSNPLRQIIVKEWKPIKMEQRQWFTL